MEKYLKFFILILLISIFFSDWGFFVKEGDRPIISFSELFIIIFFFIWFFRKILQKKTAISRDSFLFFLLILGIIFSANIGALIHFQEIDRIQHFFGILRFLFWGIFLFYFFDIIKENYKNIDFSEKLWKYYLNFSLIVAILGIFQYFFYFFFKRHINLNPYFQQHWGVLGGYYRATSIFQEPSFLGVILVPPFIATLEIFLTKERLIYLIKSLILFLGVLMSLSLGSFLVLLVFVFLKTVQFIYEKISIFFKNRILRREIYLIFLITSLFIIFCFVFFYFLAPIIIPRMVFEFNQLKKYFLSQNIGQITYSSGIARMSSFKGFLLVLRKSPFFGFGFDQEEYIKGLLGAIFESNTGSGISGFVGTSAGIIGVLLIFAIFYIVWKGGYKGLKSGKKKIKKEPDLFIVGKAIILALFLEQLISYGGILNPDFWLPLAFAFWFIRSGNYQKK